MDSGLEISAVCDCGRDDCGVAQCGSGAAAFVRFPVPVRAWFEPQYLDTRPKLYVAMNMITSHTDDQQSRQVTRATLAKLMIIVKAEYPEMGGWHSTDTKTIVRKHLS